MRVLAAGCDSVPATAADDAKPNDAVEREGERGERGGRGQAGESEEQHEGAGWCSDRTPSTNLQGTNMILLYLMPMMMQS